MSETNTNPEARVVEAVARVRARLGILADESHWPDYVDEARELISAHTKALAAEGKVIEDDWRPIDSAPKDGTEILVPYPIYKKGLTSEIEEYRTIIVFWKSVGWDTGAWMLHETPDLWRPLPIRAAISTPTLPPAGDER